MKKLMIATAVVATAMFAHAYSINWAVYDGTYQDWNGSAITSDGTPVTAFLYALSGDTGITYKDGAFVTSVGDKIGTWLYGADDLDGWGNAANEPTPSTVPALGKEIQNFQVVLVEGDVSDLASLADGTHYAILNMAPIEGNQSADPSSPGITGYDYLDDFTNVSKSDWATTAPEPTSGLLLLIGVAGLALRRRRA